MEINNDLKKRQWKENGIRKVVWDGRYIETDEGRVIRGAVGRTHGGDYKAAEVSLYEEYGPRGRVAFSAESWTWSKKPYAHKEQAIFEARRMVGNVVRSDQRCEEVSEAAPSVRKGAADKYAAAPCTRNEHELAQERNPKRSL